MNPFMNTAIQSAREGIRKNHGGPFGACIVKKGKIIARAHNTVLRDRDPTCHAEINAIRQACRKLKTHDLRGCVLYTTAEPCPMCLGAIYWAKIARVVTGVPATVAYRFGFRDAKIYEDMGRPLQQRKVRMRAGVMQKEVQAVFIEWERFQRPLY